MSERKKNKSGSFVREYCVPAIIAIMIISNLLLSKVEDWPHTDPKGSLLSGQVFLDTGTFVLADDGTYLPGFTWQLMRKGDDIIYSYPIGTTLIHLPAIWVANACGWDMWDIATEAKLNRVLAAISVGILFMLIFRLNRRWNRFSTSLFISILLVMGTGIYSTLGLALWNLNYFVIIALLLFSILLKRDSINNPDTGWVIGILLFIGFAVRPSFALVVLVVFVFLLIQNYRQCIRASVASATLLSIFILFSISTYGTLLPGNYQVSDFSELTGVLINFAGHMISPSRGLLLFSPFMIFTIYAAVINRSKWKEYPFLKYILFLLFAQLCFVSVWFMWWGGGGFGNRLSMELWPSLIIITSFFLGSVIDEGKPMYRMLIVPGLVVTGLISLWIHVVQGANNQLTVTWFQHPNKDQYPEYFWNPRFPQMFASEKQIERMDKWHWDHVLSKQWERDIKYEISDENLHFSSWYETEENENKFRWSKGKSVGISALIPPDKIHSEEVFIGLDTRTYKDQVFHVTINGKPMGKIEASGKVGQIEYYFGPTNLDGKDKIEIQIYIEFPKSPILEEPEKSPDPRELGICLFGLSVYSKRTPPTDNP